MTRRGRSGGAVVPADALEARLEREKGLPPVLAAAGPESFLQDLAVAAALRLALGDPDSPHAVVLHGPARPGESGAPSLAEVLEDVRTPSLFGPSGRKVVVLRRADHLLAAEADALRAHLARPAGGSHLVLVTEAAPGDRNAPKKVRDALEAVAAEALVVSCVAPSAEPRRGGGASPLAEWVAGRARARGKRLDAADAELLVLRSGTTLATLDAAVGAAALLAGDAPRIARADLEAVAPRGAAEGIDRFVEALLAREPAEALRVLAGLYREGAVPWGARSPVRGESSVTFLLLNQIRRTARDARQALLQGSGGFLPPSLRFGCRDPGRVLRARSLAGLAALLADLTALEAALKGGFSGGERARLESLVVRHGEPA